ncbi:MAG: hypothetical protein HYS05_03900 [Acidobacteria bacterium]|nr:hypothetical protein [Acidobacteriota bacterium]
MPALNFLKLTILPPVECVKLGTLPVDEPSSVLHANWPAAINCRESSVDRNLFAREFGEADSQMMDVRISGHAGSPIRDAADHALRRAAFRHVFLKVCQSLDEEDRREIDSVEVAEQACLIDVQQFQCRLVEDGDRANAHNE